MTERKLQPQLRFPGFEGQWEEKKLEEIAKSITSGKTKPNDEGTCSVYGSMGIIGYCDIPTHNGKYLLV
ncbi:MAG: restriction endonuclease subunit S, partial [Tannerellaceae bacterium]|nr:restriction endonuclease subunit S [Tannerellaceae bacterium]